MYVYIYVYAIGRSVQYASLAEFYTKLAEEGFLNNYPLFEGNLFSLLAFTESILLSLFHCFLSLFLFSILMCKIGSMGACATPHFVYQLG